MFDTSLMEAVASVSGPALLTNASALLLGGASNRYLLAVQASRGDAASDVPTYPDSSSRRVALSAAAVHALHIALIAFGVDCVLLLASATLAPFMQGTASALDAVAIVLAFAGLAGLTCGVVLMATEGLWGFKTDRAS